MKRFWMGVGLAVTVLSAAGCGTPRVEVVAATKTSAPFVYEAEARPEALYSLPVVSRVSGKIISALPEVGTEVSAGELLFQIDASRYEEQLAALRPRTQGSAAPMADSSMEASLLKQGIITRAEYERLRGRRMPTAASADEAASEARLALSRAIADCTVTAPIDGVVAKIYVDDSRMAAAGKPVLLLRQSSPVVCEVEIPETMDALLAEAKEQRSLTVTLSAADGSRAWYGELKRQVESDEGLSRYKVQADNPDGAIAVGEVYRVRIDSGKNTEGYLVPKTAFLRPTQVEIVTADNLVDVRDVAVACDIGDDRLVIGGLSDGDRVIIKPDASLVVGTEVTAKEMRK